MALFRLKQPLVQDGQAKLLPGCPAPTPLLSFNNIQLRRPLVVLIKTMQGLGFFIHFFFFRFFSSSSSWSFFDCSISIALRTLL